MKPFVIIAVLSLAAPACSHTPQVETATPKNPTELSALHEGLTHWENTSIEIQYTLGHIQRRIVMMSDTQVVRGETFHEGALLKKHTIDHLRYSEFLHHIMDFTNKRRKLAGASSTANQRDCRAPYTITVKNLNETKQFSGCRHKENGEFAHLIKDGEFLIYSQK